MINLFKCPLEITLWMFLKGDIHVLNNKKNTVLKTFAGGRGDSGTLRSTKSEESLTSLHNVDGNLKLSTELLQFAPCGLIISIHVISKHSV